MLLAHNGVSHQKTQSNDAKQPNESKVEANRSTGVSEPKNLPTKPELESQPQKKEEVPTKAKVESQEKSITIQEAQPKTELETATLVPGFGESIFALLIASPFILLGFKKWRC